MDGDKAVNGEVRAGGYFHYVVVLCVVELVVECDFARSVAHYIVVGGGAFGYCHAFKAYIGVDEIGGDFFYLKEFGFYFCTLCACFECACYEVRHLELAVRVVLIFAGDAAFYGLTVSEFGHLDVTAVVGEHDTAVVLEPQIAAVLIYGGCCVGGIGCGEECCDVSVVNSLNLGFYNLDCCVGCKYHITYFPGIGACFAVFECYLDFLACIGSEVDVAA